MRSSLLAIWSCLLFISGFQKTNAQEVPGKEDYSALVTYYGTLGLDYIVPVGERTKETQDWFRTDVDRFVNDVGGTDFLDAKRRFYSKIDFDKHEQLHLMPYHTLDSWGPLNHPPIKVLNQPFETYVSGMKPLDFDRAESKYFDPEFQRNLDFSSESELTFGNNLQLLPNSDSIKEKMRMAKDAKKFFFGTVMFYKCEKTTEALIDVLGERVRAGVDVRIILEGFHNATGNARCAKKMRKAGIDVLTFSDAFKTLGRTGVDHNKFWIRDGVEAIVGGQNMHDSSNLSDGFNFETRDTDVLIKSGPAVTDLLNVYVEIWNSRMKSKNRSIEDYRKIAKNLIKEERQKKLRGSSEYRRVLNSRETRMNGVCRVLSQRNGAQTSNIADAYLKYIEGAGNSIFVSSPSVSFDLSSINRDKKNEVVVEALRDKAQKDNITVDIVTNGRSGGGGEFKSVIDSLIEKTPVALFSELFASVGSWFSVTSSKGTRNLYKLLDSTSNMHVYNYMMFIHSKLWMFDRIMTSIGSWNLDSFSANKNYETTIVCLDKSLSLQAEVQIVKDLINSNPIVSKNGL